MEVQVGGDAHGGGRHRADGGVSAVGGADDRRVRAPTRRGDRAATPTSSASRTSTGTSPRPPPVRCPVVAAGDSTNPTTRPSLTRSSRWRWPSSELRSDPRRFGWSGGSEYPRNSRMYPRGMIRPVKLGQWLFHQVTDKDYVYTPESGHRSPEQDEESDNLFLARMGGRLDFDGKTVLDVGCGNGSLCAKAARSGATRVVGIDLELAPQAEGIRDRYPDVAERISFVATQGQLAEIAGEQFDLVISKDSMEHFPQPESFVRLMTDLVKPGGEFAVGFSPLWKSPYGGHIGFMTRVPWAHLLFSEKTIMAERRRFRPDEHAESFSEIKGGLNKMTFERFCSIMASTGFDPIYFETNVGNSQALKAMKVLAKVRAAPRVLHDQRLQHLEEFGPDRHGQNRTLDSVTPCASSAGKHARAPLWDVCENSTRTQLGGADSKIAPASVLQRGRGRARAGKLTGLSAAEARPRDPAVPGPAVSAPTPSAPGRPP